MINCFESGGTSFTFQEVLALMLVEITPSQHELAKKADELILASRKWRWIPSPSPLASAIKALELVKRGLTTFGFLLSQDEVEEILRVIKAHSLTIKVVHRTIAPARAT